MGDSNGSMMRSAPENRSPWKSRNCVFFGPKVSGCVTGCLSTYYRESRMNLQIFLLSVVLSCCERWSLQRVLIQGACKQGNMTPCMIILYVKWLRCHMLHTALVRMYILWERSSVTVSYCGRRFMSFVQTCVFGECFLQTPLRSHDGCSVVTHVSTKHGQFAGDSVRTNESWRWTTRTDYQNWFFFF